ncbi:MAG: hypothetical protein QOG21_838 [Actinomycetota bacterium]|jgi:PPOX class probable F420-dependent enzyme|nr:hypothetical protein [Actinomycetota bacterium]
MVTSETTVPDDFAQILQKKAFAHIASIAADGSLQSNPVWFDWDGSRLLFSTVKSRQKYKNLKARPAVAVSILDPDEPYRYLELRGDAEIDEEPEAAESFINRMSQKYTGEDWDRPGQERVIVAVRPRRILTYP